MYKLNFFDKLSLLLVLIGSINWGLIGLFDFNLIDILLREAPLIERLVYVVILVSAINLSTLVFKCNYIDNDD